MGFPVARVWKAFNGPAGFSQSCCARQQGVPLRLGETSGDSGFSLRSSRCTLQGSLPQRLIWDMDPTSYSVSGEIRSPNKDDIGRDSVHRGSRSPHASTVSLSTPDPEGQSRVVLALDVSL